MAYHLSCIKRMLAVDGVEENNIENADETHFMINMDDGKILGFCGEKEVKYADVVSGGERITMLLRISGGRDYKIEPPFLIFINSDRQYPIRGIPDDVPGVAYRTGPKGWMETSIFLEYFRDWRVIKPLHNNRKRVLFVDSCSGHNSTQNLEEALAEINPELHYFPEIFTHLLQPCDSFIIQKI